MGKRTITYSELRERRRCPYRAHLNYDLLISPVVKSPGLREGTIFDEGMNALYAFLRTGGERYRLDVMLDAMRETWDRERRRIEAAMPMMAEEWGPLEERLELLFGVARAYIDYAREHDRFEVIVSTQYEGLVPVVTDGGRSSTKYDFRFKLDGLVVIDGKLWILENKAWKTIAQDAIRMLPMDEQCGMYLWALTRQIERGEAPKHVMDAVAQFGMPVGVYYNVIRKAVPKVPALLKDGKTSRDIRCDTTAAVYERTLLERGQDPADYADVLEALKAKGDTFHFREAVYRNATELAEIGQRIHEGTRYLAGHHQFKFPERSCSWECAFFAYCLEPSEDLLASQYRTRERVHEEYTEEIEEAA
jgi:hypothetical protein